MTAAATAMGLLLGILCVWSVITAGIPDAWGWSNAEKALPYSVACMVFALTMVPAGRLQDRLASRRHRRRRLRPGLGLHRAARVVDAARAPNDDAVRRGRAGDLAHDHRDRHRHPRARRAPRAARAQPAATTSAPGRALASAEHELGWREMLRTRQFWMLYLPARLRSAGAPGEDYDGEPRSDGPVDTNADERSL